MVLNGVVITKAPGGQQREEFCQRLPDGQWACVVAFVSLKNQGTDRQFLFRVHAIQQP